MGSVTLGTSGGSIRTMTRTLDSYKKLCTEFYDLDKTGPPQPAFDWYWGRYGGAGGPALEAMCGSGRFLVPFATRGADIDGVDASPHMLSACRRKAAEAGVSPGIYEQFLQEIDLPRTYRFAFCPAGSFQLIPRDEQLPALRAIARHMERGAELVLEMGFPGETPTGPSSQDAERRVVRPDGAEIVLNWDESGMMRYDLVRDGEIIETEYETFVLHPTPRHEFEAMLAGAGFKDIRGLWPYKDEIARPNAPFAVFVCTRA
jgi:SAM-dependent methyltransferase